MKIDFGNILYTILSYRQIDLLIKFKIVRKASLHCQINRTFWKFLFYAENTRDRA